MASTVTPQVRQSTRRIEEMNVTAIAQSGTNVKCRGGARTSYPGRFWQHFEHTPRDPRRGRTWTCRAGRSRVPDHRIVAETKPGCGCSRRRIDSTFIVLRVGV
jgi:hypothetical protein